MIRSLRVCATVIALAATVLPANSAVAQAPPGSDTISARAAAESLKVLDRLGRATRANPKDAASWYRRGMIAFALMERTREPDSIPALNYRALRLTAADALLAALNLEPTNEVYARSLSQFHLTDHSGIGHSAGRMTARETDLDVNHVDADTAARVQRLLDAGWGWWLDYDGYADRAMSSFEDKMMTWVDPRLPTSSGPPADASPRSVFFAASTQQIKGELPPNLEIWPISAIMKGAIDSVSATLAPVSFDAAGEAVYLKAEQHFRVAYTLAPANDRAFRYLAMLLAARDNWIELAKLAHDHTRRAPGDPWGWMTVALAGYLLRPGKEARVAFDSAFARLDSRERLYLDRFDRVLRPADSALYVKYDSATRANAANTSWLLAAPLWSAPQADPRTEFLARVTFAELRWSVPEQNAHGADTKRGEIYIRYGPPNRILGFQPRPSQVMYTFWVYNADLIFAFTKFLHSGTAVTAPFDANIVDRVKEWQPARWDNIATLRIDSMPTQVARFRAGADSVDMFLATRAPLAAMRKAATVNSPAFAHYWLYSRNSPTAFTDSVELAESDALRWTRRVPAGPYYYRVESTIPEALVSGRTAGSTIAGRDTATGFTTRGFGLSDILLATTATTTATAAASTTDAPRRWRDLDVVPLLGDIAKGAEIALVWETYELGRAGADARYDVAITIERQRGKGGRIAAQIAGRLAGAVGIDVRKDKVEMRYERTVPFAPVVAENVSVALGDTPPGAYRLTVQITDRVSRRVTSRGLNLVIRE